MTKMMMTKTMRTRKPRNPYTPRVRRGARLLDVLCPGWAGHIVCDRLAMESCNACMMGQLYGSYVFGCRVVAMQLPRTFLFSAAEHGFTLFDREQQKEFDEAFHVTNKAAILARFGVLADAWRDEIAARLGAS